MTKEDRIIELLEEQIRLLSILVAPVVALKSTQLASATPDDQKRESKEAIKRAQQKFGRGGKGKKS